MTILNDLGGNMPQERVDRIKAAWMENYGATEQDWYNFQNKSQETVRIVTTDEEDFSVELIPSCEELAFRHRSTAKYHLSKARQSGRTPTGLQHFSDAMVHVGLAKDFMDQHVDSLRKVKGWV